MFDEISVFDIHGSVSLNYILRVKESNLNCNCRMIFRGCHLEIQIDCET